MDDLDRFKVTQINFNLAQPVAIGISRALQTDRRKERRDQTRRLASQRSSELSRYSNLKPLSILKRDTVL